MNASQSGAFALGLTWLDGHYAVCRFDAHEPMPAWVTNAIARRSCDGTAAARLFSITRTDRELSIVIDESILPEDIQCKIERGFAAMRIIGTLDFAMVGVLAKLTSALAVANVPVFVISTFDTDYLLVRETDRALATNALEQIARFLPI